MALPVILNILDTAGQDEYKALRENYMKTGEGFILVYDVTSRYSFEEVQKLYKQICTVKDRENTPIVLLGNKTDIAEAQPEKRQVSRAEGLIMAKRFGKSAVFWETSARKRQHVQDAFFDLVRLIRRQNMEPAIPLNRVIGHIHTTTLNARPPTPNDHHNDSSTASVIRKAASKASLRSTSTVFSTARKLSNSSSFNNFHYGSNNNSNINLANGSSSINSNNSNSGNGGKSFSNFALAFGSGASRILSFTLGRTNNNGVEGTETNKISSEKELRSSKSRQELLQRGRYYSQVSYKHQMSPQSPTIQHKLRRQSDNVTGTNTDTNNVFFNNGAKNTRHLYGSLSEKSPLVRAKARNDNSPRRLKPVVSHQQLSDNFSVAQRSIRHRKSMPLVSDHRENRQQTLLKNRLVEPPLPPLPIVEAKQFLSASSLSETSTIKTTPTTPVNLPSPVTPDAHIFVPPSPCSPTSNPHETTPMLSLVIPSKREQFPATPDSPNGGGFSFCISRTFNKIKTRMIKSRAYSAPEPATKNDISEACVKRGASLEKGKQTRQTFDLLDDPRSTLLLTTQTSLNSALSDMTGVSHSASIQIQLAQKQHQKYFQISPFSQAFQQNAQEEALSTLSEQLSQLPLPQLPQSFLQPQLPLLPQLSLQTPQHSLQESLAAIPFQKIDAPLPPLPHVIEDSKLNTPTNDSHKSSGHRQKTCEIKYSKYQDRYSQQYQEYQKMLKMKENALKKSNKINGDFPVEEQNEQGISQNDFQYYYNQTRVTSQQKPTPSHGVAMGY